MEVSLTSMAKVHSNGTEMIRQYYASKQEVESTSRANTQLAHIQNGLIQLFFLFPFNFYYDLENDPKKSDRGDHPAVVKTTLKHQL